MATQTRPKQFKVKDPAVAAAFAAKAYAVPGVRAVYWRKADDGVFHFWTVTEHEDDATDDAISVKLLEMYDEFPGMLLNPFGFALDRMKMSLEEAIPSGFVLLTGPLERAAKQTIPRPRRA